MDNQKSVPSISKDSPLKVEELQEGYKESEIEKKGKMVFISGSVFAALILISVWILFAYWIKNFI